MVSNIFWYEVAVHVVQCKVHSFKAYVKNIKSTKLFNAETCCSVVMYIDVFKLFGRLVYPFGHPNSVTQKTLFRFSFLSCISTKYTEVVIIDFMIYLIILKWLRIQKLRLKRKTLRQIGWSEGRNCDWRCFHSFNCVIDQVFASSVR